LATEQQQRKLIDAFTRISEVWGVARRGLIVSTAGTRVGTWSWNKSNLLINPRDDEFKKLIRRLIKDGVFVRQTARRELDVPKDVEFPGDTSVLLSKPLTRLTPGEFDHALKVEGYFVVDLDVPLGEE